MEWLEWGESPHLVHSHGMLIEKTKAFLAAAAETEAKAKAKRKIYMAKYMEKYRKDKPLAVIPATVQALILESEPEPEAPKKLRNLPVTESAQRIAALFSRRLSTGWSDRECSAYKKLGTIEPQTMDLLDQYYAYQRSQPNGIHRRDLSTFLNNFGGETDRATQWQMKTNTTQQRNDTAFRL